MATLLVMALMPAAAQKLQVAKGTIDCGKVKYRHPVTATFEMKNKGGKKLKIQDVRVSCGCLDAEYPKYEIASGESFTLKLTYDAKQMGHFHKEARIYSNGSKQPVSLVMNGVVQEEVNDFSGQYPYVVGKLRVDKRDIEFDDVSKGDQPEQDIHVLNEGMSVLAPNLMHLPAFLSATVTPEYLRPGMAGKITVKLLSSKLHDYGIATTSVHLANKLGDKVSADNEVNVSAVLLPSFDDMTQQERHNAPKVKLSAEKVDIDFEGKEKKTERVEITNYGGSRLKLSSLHMFSSAMKVTLGKSELAPGEKTTLKMVVYKDELAKARTQPRVLMITNDPEHPKVVIKVNAK